MNTNETNAFNSLSSEQSLLLMLFALEDVKYLVIGGYAVRFYGSSRYAQDLDILVDRSPDNVRKVARILSPSDVKEEETFYIHLTQPRKKIKWKHDIEIVSSTNGFQFEDLFREHVQAMVDATPVFIISKQHLIQIKEMAIHDDPRRTLKETKDISFLKSTSKPK